MLSRILDGYLKIKTLFYIVYISISANVIWGCTFWLIGVSWIESDHKTTINLSKLQNQSNQSLDGALTQYCNCENPIFRQVFNVISWYNAGRDIKQILPFSWSVSEKSVFNIFYQEKQEINTCVWIFYMDGSFSIKAKKRKIESLSAWLKSQWKTL